MIDYINLSKVETHQFKNQLEIAVLLVSVPAIFANQVAMIFPIIYVQYIRIKYVGSFSLRKTFNDLGALLDTHIPTFYNLSAILWFRSYAKSFVNFKDKGEEKKDTSFRDEKVDNT